jgi:F0F1-type ATP synthase membrane subunit c/vacuolar-type H+-ATPase subunit K
MQLLFLIFVFLVVGLAAPALAQQTAADRALRNVAEFDELFRQVFRTGAAGARAISSGPRIS